MWDVSQEAARDPGEIRLSIIVGGAVTLAADLSFPFPMDFLKKAIRYSTHSINGRQDRQVGR